MVLSLRLANTDDLPPLCGSNHLGAPDESRQQFIIRRVEAHCCHVAVLDEQIVGYGVLEYSFFEQGFISLLFVNPQHRRTGIGRALMEHLQSRCSTTKLFTSTNLSNVIMQSLLGRLDFSLSGVIHNLDEGDPELIFFKRLDPPTTD